MSTATAFPTLANYQTRLPSFEGPLDVLLRLIERHQLEITDVSLVQVTDQFLAYVGEMEDQSPNVIAEFTMVGTRLTLLKSRSLLPKPPAADEEGEPDPSDLVKQLQAYKRLKEAAAELGKRREAGMVSYAPGGTGPVARPGKIAPPKLAHYEPSVLIRSLRRRLSTVPQAMQTVRQRRIISIREMIDRVIDVAGRLPSFRFSTVTETYTRRSEVATAFLATLILIRRGSLQASQDGLFGEIDLASGGSLEADSASLAEDADEFTVTAEPETVPA